MGKAGGVGAILVVLVFAAAVHALTEEALRKRDRISKECREKTGATVEDVYNMRRGRFPDSLQARSHYLCFQRQYHVINDNNEFDQELVRTQLRRFTEDELEINDIVSTCTVDRINLSDEHAFWALQCLVKQMLKLSRLEQFQD